MAATSPRGSLDERDGDPANGPAVEVLDHSPIDSELAEAMRLLNPEGAATDYFGIIVRQRR